MLLGRTCSLGRPALQSGSRRAVPLSSPAPGAPLSNVGQTIGFSHQKVSSDRNQRAVVARISPGRVTTTETDEWWAKGTEGWVEVHTEEEFLNDINDEKFELVLVDFYAPWCKGCKTMWPKLQFMAQDRDYNKKMKFVKVNIDSMKQFCKEQGAVSMPWMNIYRPGEEGALVGWQGVASRFTQQRTNIRTVLNNSGAHFMIDPMGTVVVTDKATVKKVAKVAQKKEEVIEKGKSRLFERLLSVAEGKRTTGATTPSRAEPAVADEEKNDPFAAALRAKKAAGTPLHDWSCDSGKMAKKIFTAQNPGYGYDGRIDEWYTEGIEPRLDEGHHYLDYTGAGLYTQGQLKAAMMELGTNLFGNPHSVNPSSSLSTKCVEAVRERVLKFFNADPTEYQVVFTRSATDALKIVGETFPWSPASEFRYLRENHNSVLGIREYTMQHGGHYSAVDEASVEAWLAGGCACGVPPPDADAMPHTSNEGPAYSMFAFPGEDNFAGVKYPLEWIKKARSQSTSHHKWKVLLDAAAFVPTQPLDLREYPADFVSVSFYKIFGYPTGIGALIVRTENIDLLKKAYWGGGSVALATSSDDFHVLRCNPSDKLEDGTLPFLNIIVLKHGFDQIESMGGITAIQTHVQTLVAHFFKRAAAMKHRNGAPLVKVFGKHHHPDAAKVQGGILNFEVLHPDGTPCSYKTVEREAAEAGFHIRTGAECNPGACYAYLGIPESEIEALADIKEGCDDDIEFIRVQRPESSDVLQRPTHEGSTSVAVLGASQDLELTPELLESSKWVEVPIGTIRASLGMYSRFEDVEAFLMWMEAKFKNRTSPK